MKSILLLLFVPIISGINLPLHNGKEKNQNRAKVIPLKNKNNEAYSIDLSIGSPPQEFELLLSTGNCSLSWIVYSDCFNCKMPENEYAPWNSISKTNLAVVTSLYYGYNSFQATLYSDDFKLSDSLEYNQEFWLATSNLNYPGPIIDGVFNLGIDNNDQYPSTIESLYYNGIIDWPTFSIYLSKVKSNQTDTDSRLIFGSANLEPYIGQNLLKQVEIVPNYLGWTTILNSVYFGTTENYIPFSSYATFDVNSPYIYIPNADFPSILDYFILFYDCERSSTNIIQCDEKNIEKYPTITFVLDQQYFSIPNTAYIKYDNEADELFLLIAPNSYQNWILGSPFLREFISVFTRMPSRQPTLSLAYIDIQSEKKKSSSESFWNDWSLYFYIGIGVSGTLVVTILLIILCRLRKRRQARKNQENCEKLIYDTIEPPKPKEKKEKQRPLASPSQKPKNDIENPTVSNQSGNSGSESGIYPDFQPVPILRQSQPANADMGAYPYLAPI